MEFEILEELNPPPEDGWSSVPMPLSYRIEISIFSEKIVLKRQLLGYGLYDWEEWDKFRFPDMPSSRGSFITKKVNDSIYLAKKEEELIKKFYERIQYSKKQLQREYDAEVKKMTKKLNDHLTNLTIYENSYPFLKYHRKEKIKKIINERG